MGEEVRTSFGKILEEKKYTILFFLVFFFAVVILSIKLYGPQHYFSSSLVFLSVFQSNDSHPGPQNPKRTLWPFWTENLFLTNNFWQSSPHNVRPGFKHSSEWTHLIGLIYTADCVLRQFRNLQSVNVSHCLAAASRSPHSGPEKQDGNHN